MVSEKAFLTFFAIQMPQNAVSGFARQPLAYQRDNVTTESHMPADKKYQSLQGWKLGARKIAIGCYGPLAAPPDHRLITSETDPAQRRVHAWQRCR